MADCIVYIRKHPIKSDTSPSGLKLTAPPPGGTAMAEEAAAPEGGGGEGEGEGEGEEPGCALM